MLPKAEKRIRSIFGWRDLSDPLLRDKFGRILVSWVPIPGRIVIPRPIYFNKPMDGYTPLSAALDEEYRRQAERDLKKAGVRIIRIETPLRNPPKEPQ